MPLTQSGAPKRLGIIIACEDYPELARGNFHPSSPKTRWDQVTADLARWKEVFEHPIVVSLGDGIARDRIRGALVEAAHRLRAHQPQRENPPLAEWEVWFVFLGVGAWRERLPNKGEAVLVTPDLTRLDEAISLRELASLFTKYLPQHAVNAVFDCGFKEDGTPHAIPGHPRAIVQPGIKMASVAPELRAIDRVFPAETPSDAVEPGAFGQNGAITAALLETFYLGVELDPGNWTFRPFDVRLLDATLKGTLAVTGASNFTQGGLTWYAHKEYWLSAPSAPALFGDLSGTSFKLVPVVNGGLPQTFGSRIDHPNLAFAQVAPVTPTLAGWEIREGSETGPTVGWLQNSGGTPEWYADRASLVGSGFFYVSTGSPLFFIWNPNYANVGPFDEHL